MSKVYFEDIEVGTVHKLGSFTVDRDEMISFAQNYDTQPIHTDPEDATESIYGGIIASGWFTAAKCMRLLADEFLNSTETMGSFGLEELRWLKPVRPGDQLHVEIELLSARPSESQPDRGYITNELRAFNAAGELAISWEATNIFMRRTE